VIAAGPAIPDAGLDVCEMLEEESDPLLARHREGVYVCGVRRGNGAERVGSIFRGTAGLTSGELRD